MSDTASSFKEPSKTKSSLSELLKQQNTKTPDSLNSDSRNTNVIEIFESEITSEDSQSLYNEDAENIDISKSTAASTTNGIKNMSLNDPNINKSFSQSFITTNNAHTMTFGSSVQNQDSLFPSLSGFHNTKRNTNKSFSQKNFPSLSSSIPYSVPDQAPTYLNSNTNQSAQTPAIAMTNGDSHENAFDDKKSSNHGSLGSNSTNGSFVDLMPANVSQIDSSVIRSPQVANVEPRFVLSKQKLHEKQMSNLSWTNEHGFGASSQTSVVKKGSTNPFAGSSSYKDNSKTINHSSSFNRKQSFSTTGSGSGLTTMISRTGSIGSMLFNSKKDQTMSSSPKSASPTSSKLTSSLKNNNPNLNENQSYSAPSTSSGLRGVVDSEKFSNQSDEEIHIPNRTRQASIFNPSRTPNKIAHVNNNNMSVKTSMSGAGFSSGGSTPKSTKNSHSFVKFFKKTSTIQMASSPNSDRYNNQHIGTPSVSTFNTHAVVNQQQQPYTGSAISSSAGSSTESLDKEPRSILGERKQSESSFSSSTFQGPSSLGNTDILYQASNPQLGQNSSLNEKVKRSDVTQGLQEQALQHSSHLPFSKRYTRTGNQLGAGAGGSVSIVNRVIDKKQFAVKEFRAKYENEKKRDYIKKITGEYCIGTTLKHPNIIETVELVYENNRMLQVMEYCDFDLFAIVTSNKMVFSEIACCFKQILNGIEYLHSIGLAHRDLKLDNCVVDKHGIVKLIDFGAAVVFSYPLSNKLVTASGIVGSDPYLPPEVCIFSKYDPRPVDIWSIAMIFVCLTIKQFPWKIPKLKDSSFKLFCSGRDCDSLSQLVSRPANPPNYDEVVTGNAGNNNSSSNNPSNPNDLKIGPQSLLHKLPENSRHIIGRMVELAPARRANIDEIMEDPFVKGIDMCYVDHAGTVINNKESHEHTIVDQSVAHIAGLEKNKRK
ncbi:hypothetical protein QEN19_000762 [Hanseniaspora menglaensis]